jgi:hypothetical protein
MRKAAWVTRSSEGRYTTELCFPWVTGSAAICGSSGDLQPLACYPDRPADPTACSHRPPTAELVLTP